MANLDLTYGPNDRTQAFENHTVGHLISLAGPGTGKTYSFLNRIQALTARTVPQDAICYLTFIKEISNAFTHDYIERFTKESYEANKPRISTLHSFACRLIRNKGHRMGYDGELFFINAADDSEEANTLLEDLLPLVTQNGCRTISQLRNYLNNIKSAWRDQRDPSSLADPAPDLVNRAEELFLALRTIDWDQTIPLALELANGLPELPDWISVIQHYLIDEFQDFNQAEQALIAFLSNHATSTVIVGDDDQSLYSTRGGSPLTLRTLYADPNKDQVSLVNCYRCHRTIVTAANTFQTVMHQRPRIMNAVHDGGEILSYSFKSSKAEREFLVSFLNDSIAQLPETVTTKDGIVCLFPSWRVLDEYYKQLSPLVPCIRRKPASDPARQWLEQVLTLVSNFNHRFIQRLLLNQYGHIKPRHKQLIIRRILNDNVSVYRAVQLLLSENNISGTALGDTQRFLDFLDDVHSREPGRISPHLVAKLGVDTNATLTHLTSFVQRLGEPETENLITEFSDLILPSSAFPEEDPKAILFLTMHGSKGLTKHTVVLPGLEKAWLPGASTGNELEEKKRLFFVALTRATHRVLATFPFNRAKGDSLNYSADGRCQPSPFLANAGINVQYHR